MEEKVLMVDKKVDKVLKNENLTGDQKIQLDFQDQPYEDRNKFTRQDNWFIFTLLTLNINGLIKK